MNIPIKIDSDRQLQTQTAVEHGGIETLLDEKDENEHEDQLLRAMSPIQELEAELFFKPMSIPENCVKVDESAHQQQSYQFSPQKNGGSAMKGSVKNNDTDGDANGGENEQSISSLQESAAKNIVQEMGQKIRNTSQLGLSNED